MSVWRTGLAVALALSLTPRESAAAPQRYGVVEDLAWDPAADWDAIVEKMSTAGVQLVRMDFRWYMLEPSNNQWDFSVHDQIVAKLNARAIEVLGLLSHSPAWSNGGDGTGTTPPLQDADWRDFIRTVADHFKGRVRAWEIWNEPNLTQFFKPAPDPIRYSQMLKAAFEEIRAADPNAVVVLGGLAGNGVFMGWEPVETRYFLQALYANGIQGYFDAVAIHPYVHPITVGLGGLRSAIQATRAVLDAHGDAAKKIWLSEIGWSTTPLAWGQPTITEEDAAVWVGNVYGCTTTLGADKVFWHNFRDTGTDLSNVEHNFGLLRRDLTPKPAYLAYASLAPNLLQNGRFGLGRDCWQEFATPSPAYLVSSVLNGVYEFHREPPPPGTSNQAVVFQETGLAVPAGTPLLARFDVGNSSAVRKRISVLLLAHDFSDLAVCTFWLPPLAPMRPYGMRAHSRSAWSNAAMYFYAATAGSNGGEYRLDNVSLEIDPAGSTSETVCIDPTAPATSSDSSGDLIVNGAFNSGIDGWQLYGHIDQQVSDGVFQFIRPIQADPAGVVLQPMNAGVPAARVVTAGFALGNSSSVRKRVTILLHDLDFGDLSACTFWLNPGQPLLPYSMTTHTTKTWQNATISFYGATVGLEQWTLLDNVSFKIDPAQNPPGTRCGEPVVPVVSPVSVRVKLSFF